MYIFLCVASRAIELAEFRHNLLCSGPQTERHTRKIPKFFSIFLCRMSNKKYFRSGVASHIEVITGAESRAKASAKISLVLVGYDSKHQPLTIGRLALKEGHFWPGFVEHFNIQVPESMTQVSKIVISYDNVEPNFGWFLQQVRKLTCSEKLDLTWL